jgi:hypothetical protein
MDSAPLTDLAHDPHPRRDVRVLDSAMSYVVSCTATRPRRTSGATSSRS